MCRGYDEFFVGSVEKLVIMLGLYLVYFECFLFRLFLFCFMEINGDLGILV